MIHETSYGSAACYIEREIQTNKQTKKVFFQMAIQSHRICLWRQMENPQNLPVLTMLRNYKVYKEGSNQKDIELNLCSIFSITTFNEIYLFA